MAKELTIEFEVVGIEDTGGYDKLKLFLEPDAELPGDPDENCYEVEELDLLIPRKSLDVQVRDKIAITVVVKEPTQAPAPASANQSHES